MNNYPYQNFYYHLNENRNNYYPYMNNTMQNPSLFNPQEGFEKGNLFQNLYSTYKNYQPMKLTPRNDQERKLQELQTLTFAAHELNLYLDTHPEDQSMMTLFNDYRRKKDELMKQYEEQYGPLTVGSDEMEGNTYSWINSPWPWEVR